MTFFRPTMSFFIFWCSHVYSLNYSAILLRFMTHFTPERNFKQNSSILFQVRSYHAINKLFASKKIVRENEPSGHTRR